MFRVADGDVGCQGVLGRADGPDVQVVDICDSGVRIEDLFPDPLAVDPGRDAVQRQTQAVVQQMRGRDQDDYGDHHADDGVDDVPSRKTDDDARNQYADRNQRIGRHVQVGAFDVQIFLLVFEE